MTRLSARSRPRATAFLLCLCAIVSACSKDTPPSEPKLPASTQPDPETQRKNDEERAQLEQRLIDASPAQIRALFAECRSAVAKKFPSDNTGPYEPFMVDEYSADTYQELAAAVHGSALSDDARLKKFLKARSEKLAAAARLKKNKSKNRDSDEYTARMRLESELELRYGVIFTHDSFSGPQREERQYTCVIDHELKVRPLF